MKKIIKYARFGLLLSLSLCAWAEKTPPGNAIASADPLASKAGMAILANGGNAFDAAVAVSAVLGVVEPYHSGLGGGGFWLLHQEKSAKDIFVDGRERAPVAASKDMYLDKEGNVVPGLSLNGPLSAAIPGEPAALAYIVKHYGRLSLATDLAPAIELAEQGVVVNQRYVDIASEEDRLEQLRRYPETSRIFLKDNNVPKVGEILIQKDLAQTLKTFANKGHDGFYKGKIAEQMVKANREAGGIWQMKDFEDYQVTVRAPLKGNYHGITITTAPPPSAGGVAIITMLNILDAYSLEQLPDLRKDHYIVESMRLAYWDRAKYLGDPDYVSIPLKRLLSMSHAQKLRAYIKPDAATPSASLGRPVNAFADRSPNTTHFSIIDSEGNRVAATMSVNYLFGSSFVAKGTGVLLNDEMDDFSTKPSASNVFGLIGSEANSIASGKRPLSSMAPTFIESDDRVGVLGTPGGSRIPTMILLGILDFVDGKGPLAWVSKPRFHHQYLPDILQFENDAFTQSMQKGLLAMGYHLKRLPRPYGDMQAVQWDKKEQTLLAASDPRQIGLALVSRSGEHYGYESDRKKVYENFTVAP